MYEYFLRGVNQNINTNIHGTNSLIGYYSYAKQFNNCTINLNFDGINFIDANLSAVLFGIIHHLRRSRNIRTYVDFRSLSRDLNVLIRNGFTNYIAGSQFVFKPVDFRDSTIPLMHFAQQDADAYCTYIERDFLHQRGLKGIKFADKEQIMLSYFEIFDNVGLHANTKEPVFVCGQYFPSQCELKFTLVDLGEGFLKKIADYTKESDKINNAADAVSWAIKGNTTKRDTKGGTGLKNIFTLCLRTGGSLHIVTDDCYYNLSNKSITTQKIPNPFCGATIHLIFRFLYN